MYRRIVLVIVALITAIGLVYGLHYYMVVRLLVETQPPVWLGRAGSILIWTLAATIALLPIGERLIPPPWSRVLTVPPSLWMGPAFLIVSLLAISDVLLLLVDSDVDLARSRALVVVILVIILSARGFFNGLRLPQIKRVEIPLDGWPKALDGYGIAQLSDIHIGPIRGAGFAAQLTEATNALGADLIVITGDLVDGPVKHVGPMVEPFANLTATDGVFFVTGNHDMYSGPVNWMARVRELGIRVLTNEHVLLRDDTFALAGVHDHQGRLMDIALAEDVSAAIDGVSENTPVVLLAHDPSTFKTAHKHPISLQISGHTHDGQIWPFKYAVRLVVPWVAGLYRVGNSALYVSRGTGFWGPPMRLGAPAEITLLTLRAK
ncbi:MAG: putative MPP superfamily phosphohydrolase [Myxococcota bacterium]|jgi:predicted MPP superfamily phosphohydrolase